MAASRAGAIAARARHALLVLAFGLLAAFAVGWEAAAVEPARPAHLVIISIDGFRPEVYTGAGGHGIVLPNLAKLREAGAYARGVQGVWPSSTYPSHTTLLTGRWPDSHGITSNRRFDPERGSLRAWYWFARYRRGPSLIEAARAAGGTTAAVLWPVTVGGPADYLLAEIWALDGRPLLEVISEHSTPELLARMRRRNRLNLGALAPGRTGQYFVTLTAATAILEWRPALTLVHLSETDEAQHAHGPYSPEARAAYQQADRHIGAILAALRRAGVADRTAVAVVGDHGFAECHTKIQLNTLLAGAGLGTADEDGRAATWQAMVHANGGSAVLYLRDQDDRDVRGRALRVLVEAAQRYQHVFHLVTREQMDALHAAPGAAIGFEAREGYRFGSRWSGPLFTPDSQRGGHGYDPRWAKMHTGFILAGPGVRAGTAVPLMRMVDIAPTLAALMGWDLPEAQGLPVEGLLMRTAPD